MRAALVVMMVLCASPLWAGRSAVIVSNDGRAEDGLRLSRTLLAQGYVVERRVGLQAGAAFPRLPGDLRVTYFAGGTDGARLQSADDPAVGWDIPRSGPQLLALNVCGDAVFDPPPQTLMVRGCGDGFMDRVIGALTDGERDLAAALSAQGLTVEGSLRQPMPARIAGATFAPIMGDVVISTPASAPVQPISGGDVRILAASADALRARPVTAGMPRPSVIIGLEPDQPAPPPVRVTDVAERLRQRDQPDYADKIALGIFDPDEGDVTRAIQTELQRLRCYTGTIDGVWGNGSREAVARFNEVAQTRVTMTEPQMTAWRELIAQPDDRLCPLPVAAPAPAPIRRAPQPARAAPAQAAPAAPANEGGISPNFFGTGVFR